MPTERMIMRKLKEILRLKLDCGLTHRQIQRAVGVSIGAVSKYCGLAEQAGLSWPMLERLDDTEIERLLQPAAQAGMPALRIEPDYAQIHRELKRKGVTLMLLWEEYRGEHPEESTYRYTQFTQRYRDFAASLKRSMRQTHLAGEKLFVDYAGHTLPIWDEKTGSIAFAAQIFVAVLGASNYTFACATARQSMGDWLGSIGRAFEYIGGVSALVVPDNPRALVGQADRYEPQLQSSVHDFARHYGCAVLPARPYRPQDKAKAEFGVQLVERWILARLRNRRFFSLLALDQAVAALLIELNAKPFQKLDGSRRSWFEEIDCPALKPLPVTRYELAQFKSCRVNIDYHIEVEESFYSVPHALGRAQVEARVTGTTVEILFKGKRVASHMKAQKRGTYVTVSAHMPAAHQAHAQWSPSKLIAWGARVGPSSGRLIERLLSERPHPEMGYRAVLGLMRLCREYGEPRLEAACERALAIGSARYKSVASILKAKLDAAPRPETASDWTSPVHAHVRGPDYYQ
jgi:transposase